jgi:hypothetical protein
MNDLPSAWFAYLLLVVGVFAIGVITWQMLDFVMYQVTLGYKS